MDRFAVGWQICPSFLLIPRQSTLFAQQLATWFPVLVVTDPGQSGKTTLVRELFPQLPYRSLEDPDVRAYVERGIQ